MYYKVVILPSGHTLVFVMGKPEKERVKSFLEENLLGITAQTQSFLLTKCPLKTLRKSSAPLHFNGSNINTLISLFGKHSYHHNSISQCEKQFLKNFDLLLVFLKTEQMICVLSRRYHHPCVPSPGTDGRLAGNECGKTIDLYLTKHFKGKDDHDVPADPYSQYPLEADISNDMEVRLSIKVKAPEATGDDPVSESEMKKKQVADSVIASSLSSAAGEGIQGHHPTQCHANMELSATYARQLVQICQIINYRRINDTEDDVRVQTFKTNTNMDPENTLVSRKLSIGEKANRSIGDIKVSRRKDDVIAIQRRQTPKTKTITTMDAENGSTSRTEAMGEQCCESIGGMDINIPNVIQHSQIPKTKRHITMDTENTDIAIASRQGQTEMQTNENEAIDGMDINIRNATVDVIHHNENEATGGMDINIRNATVDVIHHNENEAIDGMDINIRNATVDVIHHNENEAIGGMDINIRNATVDVIHHNENEAIGGMDINICNTTVDVIQHNENEAIGGMDINIRNATVDVIQHNENEAIDGMDINIRNATDDVIQHNENEAIDGMDIKVPKGDVITFQNPPIPNKTETVVTMDTENVSASRKRQIDLPSHETEDGMSIRVADSKNDVFVGCVSQSQMKQDPVAESPWAIIDLQTLDVELKKILSRMTDEDSLSLNFKQKKSGELSFTFSNHLEDDRQDDGDEILAIVFKCPSRMMPEQVQIQAYPVLNAQQRALFNQVLCYEFLRLMTFRISEAPIYTSSSITEIAAVGFYYFGESQVKCFSCGKLYNNFLSGIPLINAHEPRCRWLDRNKPLSCFTEGLTQDKLNEFMDVLRQQHSAAPGDRPTAAAGSHHRSGGRAEAQKPSPSISHDNAGFHVQSGSLNGASFASSATEFDVHADEVSKSRYPSPHTGVISQEASPSSARTILTSATREAPYNLESGYASGYQSRGLSLSAGITGADEDSGGESGSPYDLSGASYPQFASREARRETFKYWSPEHTQKPEELVDLGFFYSGYSDCARCFFCGLGLKYWRPNDDAAYQHARFRPHCLYNRLVKGEDFIESVQNDISQGTAAGAANRSEYESRIMRSQAVADGAVDGWSMTDMRDAFSRMLQGSRSADAVDSISYESLKPFLENVRRAREMQRQEGSLAADGGAGFRLAEQDDIPRELPSPLNDSERISLAEEEHEKLKRKMFCSVCKVNRIGCVFLPCGHVVACKECGDRVSTCSLCSKRIAALADIFLSQPEFYRVQFQTRGSARDHHTPICIFGQSLLSNVQAGPPTSKADWVLSLRWKVCCH